MKKYILLIIFLYSVVLAENNDTMPNQPQSNYRDYVQGSISAIYTVPVSDSKSSVEEDYGSSVSSAEIDLLLFKKYYGGLYVGYSQVISKKGNAFYVEKRVGKFSLYYKNISSEFDATPTSIGTTTFTAFDGSKQIGTNGTPKTINYSYDKIELKYYGTENIKDRGWFSLFYEKVNTGIAGDTNPVGSGNLPYYTDARIDNFALYAGIEQLDYMMDDGFDINKIGASVGMANIEYTDALKSTSEFSFGVNLEAYYKYSFSEYSSIIFAVHGDFVGIGNIIEYGTIGGRCALSF